LLLSGRYVETAASLKQAIALKPNLNITRIELAKHYRDLNRNKKIEFTANILESFYQKFQWDINIVKALDQIKLLTLAI
jgi:hypothetical protein